MSEKHYLDENWDDLPLPDGEQSWQKMQLLLDKEEKRRRIGPLWWQYAGLGLVVITFGVGSWLLTKTDKIGSQTSQLPEVEMTDNKSKRAVTNNPTTSSQTETSPLKKDVVTTEKNYPISDPVYKKLVQKRKDIKRTNSEDVIHLSPIKKEKGDLQKFDNKKPSVSNEGKSDNVLAEPFVNLTEKKKSERDATETPLDGRKDSTTAKDTVVAKPAEPAASQQKKKAQKRPHSELVFSAGVGLQQAIAFDGQQSSAYNYKGKRSAVSDRIPSLYLRVQKKAWFAQAEFQYAVPLPVKQFVFSQKTKYSVASQNLNTEQFSLQKLYYHQLPFTLNYYILPEWSIGTGAMYNILAGAVTEQEVKSKNFQTGAESISRNITPVRGYKDSFLYKTTTGIILQTDYHWKRFSVGLRFTQNLQPFIRYTAPGGNILDEKNKMLQALLRFRLFEK